jgi:outer membrane protein assembly factor BamB
MVVARDTTTGQQIWSYAMMDDWEHWVTDAVLDGGVLYVATDTDGVFDSEQSVLGVDVSEIGAKRDLIAFDLATGRELGRIGVPRKTGRIVVIDRVTYLKERPNKKGSGARLYVYGWSD